MIQEMDQTEPEMDEIPGIKMEVDEDEAESGWLMENEPWDDRGNDNPPRTGGVTSPPQVQEARDPTELTIIKLEPTSPVNDRLWENDAGGDDATPSDDGGNLPEALPSQESDAVDEVADGRSPPQHGNDVIHQVVSTDAPLLTRDASAGGRDTPLVSRESQITVGVCDGLSPLDMGGGLVNYPNHGLTRRNINKGNSSSTAECHRSYGDGALLRGLLSSWPAAIDTPENAAAVANDLAPGADIFTNYNHSALLRRLLSAGAPDKDGSASEVAMDMSEISGWATAGMEGSEPGARNLSKGDLLRSLLSARSVAMGASGDPIPPVEGSTTESGAFWNSGDGELLRRLLSVGCQEGSKPSNSAATGNDSNASGTDRALNDNELAVLRSLLCSGTMPARTEGQGMLMGMNEPCMLDARLGSSNGEDALAQRLFAGISVASSDISTSSAANMNNQRVADPAINGDGKLLRSLLSAHAIGMGQSAGGPSMSPMLTDTSGFLPGDRPHYPASAALNDLFSAQLAEMGVPLPGNDSTSSGGAPRVAPLPDTSTTGGVPQADIDSLKALRENAGQHAVGADVELRANSPPRVEDGQDGMPMGMPDVMVDIDDVVELSMDGGHLASGATEVLPGELPGTPSKGALNGDQDDPMTGESPQELTVFVDTPQTDTSAQTGFKCDRCSRTLKTKQSLKRHKKLTCRLRGSAKSTAAAAFVCDVCSKSLKSESSLIKHKKRKCLSKDDGRRCQICREWFPKGEAFKTHLLTHEEIQPLLCRFCGKAFLVKKQLLWHEKRHTTEKSFHCGFCPKAFHSQANLTVHERTHTGERPFQCQYCDKTFKRKRTAETHEVTHTKERSFHCSVCEKSFFTKNNLNTHQKIHNRVENFPCRHCNKVYVNKWSRKVHERTHAGIKPYECQTCGKRYNHNRSLVDHMKMHSGVKPYSCSFCPKMFALKCNVIKHERVHTGEKPYKCKFCDKLFSQKNHCNDHENTHTRKKSFQCEVCDKSFFQRASLYNHRIRHLQVKPFKCQFCEKTFINRLLVTNHERTHTGEKPFKCQFCDKAFNTKGYHTVHEKLHTAPPQKQGMESATRDNVCSEFDMMERSYRKPREKLFKCHYCGKMFCTERNVRVHEQRMHIVDRISDAPEEHPIAYPDFDPTNPLYSRSLLPLLKELHAKAAEKEMKTADGVAKDTDEAVNSKDNGTTEDLTIARENATDVEESGLETETTGTPTVTKENRTSVAEDTGDVMNYKDDAANDTGTTKDSRIGEECGMETTENPVIAKENRTIMAEDMGGAVYYKDAENATAAQESSRAKENAMIATGDMGTAEEDVTGNSETDETAQTESVMMSFEALT